MGRPEVYRELKKRGLFNPGDLPDVRESYCLETGIPGSLLTYRLDVDSQGKLMEGVYLLNGG